MGVPLVHPLRLTAWSNPATWPALRAKVESLFYPSGFTARMDTVIEGYSSRPGDPYPPVVSPPTGCSRVDLLINTSPGGRSGGTPQYCWSLEPSVGFSGKNMLFQCGSLNYTAPYTWDTYYCQTDRSTILAALALGWRVVVVDNNMMGYNPGSVDNPVHAQITRSGVLTEMVYGQFYSLFDDAPGDPDPERLFTDDAYKAMNETDERFGAYPWVFSAHCGCSGYSAFLICCDDRITRSAWSRLYAPTICRPYPSGARTTGRIYMQAEVPAQEYWSIVTAAIAKSGHRAIITASARDTGQPVYDINKWHYWWGVISEAIAPVGAYLSLFEEPTLDDHSLQADEVTAMMAVLQS